MWESLGAYFALVALRVILNYASLRNYLRLPLVFPMDREPTTWPGVSIIVVAREDGQSLLGMLGSLAALTYPHKEIIVVDGSSAQSAAEIVERFGARLISAENAPSDWIPDNYARWTGAQAASQEWLLFVAPSSAFQPRSLERVMALALHDGLLALSVYLQQRCLTFWERVLLPFSYQQYFTSVSRHRIHQPLDPEALASGQYFLVQREAYVRSGGHCAVRQARDAEVALASRLKCEGVPFKVLRGEFQGSVRPYRSFHLLWQGLGGQSRDFLRRRGLRASLSLVNALLAAIAIPCAAYGLLTHSLPFELAAGVTYLTAVVELTTWQFLFQTPVVYALFQPLAAVMFLAALVRNARGSR